MKTMDGVECLLTGFIGYGVAETPAEYVIDRPTVYLDTTIPSFLTAWASHNPERARKQRVTREWWELHRWQFDIRISEHVRSEADKGDARAARERREVLQSLKEVEPKLGAEELANALMKGCGLSEKTRIDARHVALAAAHSLQFLLYWNCRHMANDVLRPKMMHICIKAGYDCPRIVTPDEIMRLHTHVQPRS
jgi:hypothetical protein